MPGRVAVKCWTWLTTCICSNSNNNSSSTNDTAPRTRIGLAIFGAGRIGAVHIQNVRTNQRAVLRWVVEEDVARATSLLRELGLEEQVKVASNSQADAVLQDKQYVYMHAPAVDLCTRQL